MVLVFFDKQKKEIKRNILAQKNIKGNTTVEGVIFDFEKWKDEMIKDSEPEFRIIIEKLAQDVMDSFADGQQIDMSLPSIRNEIGRRVKEMSHFVNTTTNNEIKKILETAEADQMSIKQKAEMIEGWFDEISKGRANLIARTETFGASNLGTQEGITQAKVTGKMWLTSRDERVRFTHQIDGDVTVADGYFTLLDGSSVAFPQDFNERCVITPRILSATPTLL